MPHCWKPHVTAQFGNHLTDEERAFLKLCSCCHVAVSILYLYLAVPCVGLVCDCRISRSYSLAFPFSCLSVKSVGLNTWARYCEMMVTLHLNKAILKQTCTSILLLDRDVTFSPDYGVHFSKACVPQTHSLTFRNTASNHCLLLQKEQNVKGGKGPFGKQAVGINNGER